MDTMPPRDLETRNTRSDDDVTAMVKAEIASMKDIVRRMAEQLAAARADLVPQSATIGGLMAALAGAQGKIIDPDKNKTAQVKSDKGNYTFSYADLGAIKNAIRGPLSEAGIAYVQVLCETDRGLRLVTRIQHGDEWMQSILPLPHIEKPQVWASTLTYLKRYALCALLGLATDGEDDDGNLGAGFDRQIEENPSRERASNGPREPKKAASPKASEAKPATPTTFTQQEAKDFRARLAACVDVETGEPDFTALSDVWLKHEELLNRLSQPALDSLVGFYRGRGWGNPPLVALKGDLSYPPEGALSNVAA